MVLNPENFVRIFIVVFIIVMSALCYTVYQQVSLVNKQKKDIIYNYQDDVIDNSTYSDFMEPRILSKMQFGQQILKIKSQIKDINLAQTVHNAHLRSTKNNLDTNFIVVLVHSDYYYLEKLLSSLQAAIGIQDAFLIFSHDYFSDTINNLISTINFTKYMQIFFPYSVQLHINVYPGKDGQFCSEGYVCKKSDSRNPEVVQSKHHWWWTVNQVFDNLDVTSSNNITIMFLEETDYVTRDFFYVFRLLKEISPMHCPFCEVLSLGAYEPYVPNYMKKTLVLAEVWTNRAHGSGIAFNRQTWNSLKANSEEFCYYNDYKWDSSFRYVGFKKWDGNVYMLVVPGSRVFHLDKCVDKDDGCELDVKVAEVEKFVQLIQSNMFPSSYVLVVDKTKDFNETATGLWEDIRDKELCMFFTKNSEN